MLLDGDIPKVLILVEHSSNSVLWKRVLGPAIGSRKLIWPRAKAPFILDCRCFIIWTWYRDIYSIRLHLYNCHTRLSLSIEKSRTRLESL
jgi:hypothetical protein